MKETRILLSCSYHISDELLQCQLLGPLDRDGTVAVDFESIKSREKGHRRKRFLALCLLGPNLLLFCVLTLI